MAGFQLSINGRFWVSTEGLVNSEQNSSVTGLPPGELQASG